MQGDPVVCSGNLPLHACLRLGTMVRNDGTAGGDRDDKGSGGQGRDRARLYTIDQGLRSSGGKRNSRRATSCRRCAAGARWQRETILTPLEGDYGETPLTPDEEDALLPEVRAALGDPVLKADVYELEQAIGDEVQRGLLEAVVDGSLSVADLVSETFLYDLHRRLYGDIWQWAGRRSTRERNIGVSPALIAVELRSSLDNIMYRWDHTNDWDARGPGLVAHAETVRIHPFVDGNGRSTRLLADSSSSRRKTGRTCEHTTGTSTRPRTSTRCGSMTSPGRSRTSCD